MKNIRVSGGKELLDIQDILENRLGIVYGAKVADLGCGGNGFFTFKVARLVGKTGLVYAVDVLKMVLTAYGIPIPRINKTKLNFKDIKETSWYAPYVAKATELNLMSPESNVDPIPTLSR